MNTATFFHGRDRWAGIRAITLCLIVLGLAVYVSIKYSEELAKINWWLVALLCVVSAVVFVLYKWNLAPYKDSSYDVSDLFMSNGRADLWKHMVLLFAMISAWVIVQQALAKTLSTEMLSIVLGIFVGKEAVGQIAVAWATRPAALNVPDNTQTIVLPAVAAPIAPVAPVAPVAPAAPAEPVPGASPSAPLNVAVVDMPNDLLPNEAGSKPRKAAATRKGK